MHARKDDNPMGLLTTTIGSYPKLSTAEQNWSTGAA